MKNSIVVLALTLASCTASKPAEPPLPDGRVVLGTFTADVDLEAGTIDIRQTPSTSETTGQAANLVNLDASVTVANSGAAWINSQDIACPDGTLGATWGANVTVKNNLAGTYLSGVYAEITTFPPAMTGRATCSNPIWVPAGMDNTYGLWSYDMIAPGATTTAVPWVFKYVTAASRFSFTGRIIGVKIDAANMQGATQRPVSTSYYNSIADNGTTILVSNIQGLAIDFVNSTTGLFQSTQTIADVGATAIAVAPNRIWYGTQTFELAGLKYRVGWMDRNGANKGFGDADSLVGVGTGVLTIVPDPVTPDAKAWVFYANDSDNAWVQSYSIADGPGEATALNVYSASAALGADNRLYVVDYMGNNVIPVRLNTEPATVETPISTLDGNCFFPFLAARGQDGKIYLSAADFSPAQVCSVSMTGTVTQTRWFGPTSTGLQGITATATGEVWGATAQGVSRAGGNWTGLDVPSPGGGGSAALIANGYLWTTADAKLWRITIQ